MHSRTGYSCVAVAHADADGGALALNVSHNLHDMIQIQRDSNPQRMWKTYYTLRIYLSRLHNLV